MTSGADAITGAIRASEGPAIGAYVTAGFPDLDSFPEILTKVAQVADLVEIGVPFTDPMADGLTIQRASHVALENGVTLDWILDLLAGLDLEAPSLLMGYYNPFLAYGLDRLSASLQTADVAGVIVPDLPLEESAELRSRLEPFGVAMVQLVTPATPQHRLDAIAGASRGFVYAVTTTGVTGGDVRFAESDLEYLARARRSSPLPVMAGFGIRTRDQVAALAPHVDGVIVGSALIDSLEAGEDPGAFLSALRLTGASA